MPIQFPRPKTLMLMSAVAAVCTIALKTLAWYVTGSVGLLSDAMESVVNLAGALFGLWMVSVAETPADREHPLGHYKAEYFASGFEGMLIFGAALVIMWTSVQRLLAPQPLEQLGWGMAFSLVSSVLNAIGAWVLIRAGRQHRSIALEADGRHLRTDVWTSIGVLLGLLLVPLTGWLWLDPLLAMGVALNILREGWQLVRRSSAGLMDSAVDAHTAQVIDATLASYSQLHRDAAGQPVLRFDHIVTRAAGRRSFVTMHMHMPAGWTLGRCATLRNQIEQALAEAEPALHATIEMLPLNVEPVQPLDELTLPPQEAPAPAP